MILYYGADIRAFAAAFRDGASSGYPYDSSGFLTVHPIPALNSGLPAYSVLARSFT
jgi:hypothetical protein